MRHFLRRASFGDPLVEGVANEDRVARAEPGQEGGQVGRGHEGVVVGLQREVQVAAAVPLPEEAERPLRPGPQAVVAGR